MYAPKLSFATYVVVSTEQPASKYISKHVKSDGKPSKAKSRYEWENHAQRLPKISIFIL